MSCCHQSANLDAIKNFFYGSSAYPRVYPADFVLLIKFLWLVSIKMSDSGGREKSYKT